MLTFKTSNHNTIQASFTVMMTIDDLNARTHTHTHTHRHTPKQNLAAKSLTAPQLR